MFERALTLHNLGTVREAAGRVFRTDLERPGFAHLLVGERTAEGVLPQIVAELAEGYQRDFGRALRVIPQGSFDQQATTQAHRDGGPDESILVLGYEPTTVPSRLLLLDFTRAALERGMTPVEFLARHNPGQPDGRRLLDEYATELADFEPGRAHVVIINNGNRPWEERRTGMLGVLHQGIIPNPDPSARRIIHSVMLAP